jgi:hypothetical protein
MNGNKTYIVSAAIVIYAITSVYIGKMTPDTAWAYVLGSGALTGLRSALKKLETK